MSKYSVSTVFKSIDKMTAPIKKMQGAVSKFTVSAENNLRKVDSAFDGISSTMFSGITTATKWGAATAAAALVGIGAINQQQQELEKLTQAVNANVQTVEAVSNALAGSGLNAENVIDLYEEMNNKLGESAGLEEITAVSESLAILGLRFTDIKKLAPEDQFKAITNAALKMEDATKAQAAADILMGGEANKVIGILRQQGKSIEDVIGNYEMLSFRTERSRQGARNMAREQTKSMKLFKSMGQEISGLAGQHLAPLIAKMNDFLIANKEIIGQSIDRFFEEMAASVGDVSTVFDRLLGWMMQAHESFEKAKEWTVTVAKITAGVLALMAALKIFIGVMTAVNLVMAASPVTLIVMGIAALTAGLAALVYYIDDVIASFDSMNPVLKAVMAPLNLVLTTIKFIKDSLTGGFGEAVTKLAERFGFADEEDTDINISRNISTEAVMSPYQQQAMYWGNMQGSVDVNVYGHGGVKPEQDRYTSQLRMGRSGN